MTAKLKPTTITSFALGMNTRRPDFRMRRTEPPYGNYMREIVNGDISNDGTLKLRRGYANVLGATAGSSIWADDAQAYYASGGTLMALSGASPLVQTVVTGAALNPSTPVSYDSAPMGGAYWTDGVTLGYVFNGASVPIVPPRPLVLPVVTLGAGALDAGIYSIAYTYVDSAGRESSASPPSTVAVSAAGALIFTLVAAPVAGFTLKAYVSLPNGVEVYAALNFVGAGTQTLTVLSSLGPACTTMGLQNMPAGRFVRYNNGRLMVAVGSVLFYSQPFIPGLYDPTSDFIPFPATITVVQTVSNEGVFICADQTYWLSGDLADTKPVTSLQFGAVMGSAADRPDQNGGFWMSDRGICVGSSGGNVKLMQDANVSVSLTQSAASLMVDRDGSIQLITSMSGSAVTPSSEGSKYASTEIVLTTITGEAWVVRDDEKQATWRYANYTFDSFAQIAAHYYGVRADGVYLLEGTTDAGAAIAFSMNPGRQDFNSELRKRMEAAYLTVSSTGTMHLAVTDDTGNTYTYNTRRNDPTVMKQRIDVGRGMTGVYLGFSITNDSGAAFELSGYELVAIETTRRLAG